MREFESTSLDLCLEEASKVFNLPKEEIQYEVTKNSTTGFFKKVHQVAIQCKDIQDLFYDVSKYLNVVISTLGVLSTPTYTYEFNPETDIITFKIQIQDSKSKKESSKIIGFQGKTLNAINVLLRLFISNKYNHHYRILLDCNNYKQRKYDQFTRLAYSIGKEVKTSRQDVELTPMTSDERRIIHNVIAKINYVESESVGAGKGRHIVIKYNPNKIVKITRFNRKNQNLNEETSTNEEINENEIVVENNETTTNEE